MKMLNLFAFFAMLLCLESCNKESIVTPAQQVQSSETSDAKKSKLVGRQQVITVPTGDYFYPTSEALLWLPKDYNIKKNSDEKYPLIIALNGKGSQGSDINELLSNGTIAQRIADGWNATAANPSDKKTYSFIVFTPQCPILHSWGWSAKHIKIMLSTLKADYRIDTKRIYITGCSAGGWGLWSCITDDDELCKQFSAIGPVSSASADHPEKISNVDKYGIACWNICGTDDAFYKNAVDYTNIINSDKPPIKAKLTGLAGVGHNAKLQAYDANWRVENKNFFEWLLQYHK